MVELVHDGTGTEAVWLDNGLENKLFSIFFKTLPEDSTGVFHILEHSLLCGSQRYPVREPFVELLKNAQLETPFDENCLRTVCTAAGDWLAAYDLTGIE